MIHLNWSFPTTALTFKWSLMISTVARTPTHHVSFTSFAHRVLAVATLGIIIEVIPDLEVPALIAESAALRWVVLPQIPPHRLNCHLYECMVKSNAMAHCADLRLRALISPGGCPEILLYNLEYGGPRIFSPQHPTSTPAFMSFQKGSAQ